jgi:dTDP-4-amino-4,6-dideoxygalactose transaminase
MGVPFYNFNDLHNEEFRTAIKEKIGKIIDTNAFVEGEYNSAFEKDFAKKQMAKHCLLVANGTDALELSLQALGIGAGDKVGVPGITFYATAEAVLNVGAEPVFIDVDAEAGLMCPKSLERVLKTTKLKAIMPVHIYGLPAPIEEIEKVCAADDVKIIEDAAQAQGTFYANGKPVGASNNLVTFSFYPTKNLSAFGDAGGILTQDDELASTIISLRNHGRGNDELLGRNSRCDHMQAAVLYQKLEKVDQYNEQRKAIAKKYHEALKTANVRLLPEHYLETSSWHLYPVHLKSVEERVKLQEALKAAEIGNTPFYDEALSEMTPLKKYSGEDEVSKNFAGCTVCLPMNPFLSDDDIQTVAQVVIAAL